ncbi:MBL fold metallo-hydrolase [Pseudoduganella albidiflava]|uniref:MBL fold metallo-hydrolase n=1 Tax=Pseudoduganella albidiflava TaxID=321983 RepID=A0A411X0F0_9BURK|nr:MBL fold metallo-hydrolase [Pseudoduganella albidiflava]QBI02422.1 MBL fold metallo-hydrolase [Pseudoduganella albidiflava]GGY42971.1 oxidoreductase [Pseudoduganella albidiflava]
MAEKKFASQADLEVKKTSFIKLSDNAYAYTAEGDPNSGVIIGDDGVMVIDTTATPVMARALIGHIRSVTDLPIKYVVLTHYHAVRVLGASAYFQEGAEQVIASRGTHEMIVERGEQDMKSEIERFPRLFAGVESVPGLTWPTMVFDNEMTIFMGQLEVKLAHVGMGHTKGDTIAYIPAQNICFSGDLVEADAAAYTGDAQLEEWPATLETLRAMNFDKLVPGRGPALLNPAEVNAGIDYTKDFVTTLLQSAKEAVADKLDLKAAMAHVRSKMDPKFAHVFIYEHCLPFDVTRAYDEASGIKHPRIWTAQRDKEMWHALQA